MWEGQIGEIDRATLRLLCGQQSPSLHTPIGGSEPGSDKLKRLDNVLRTIATQPGPDGKPGRVRYNHKLPTAVEGKEPTAFTPRRRAERRADVGLLRGAASFAEAVLNTSPVEPLTMNVDRPEGLKTYAPSSPFASPISRSLWQEQPSSSRGPFSTAVNLGTGERSVAGFPNLALKTPGPSEVSASVVDQLKVIIRDQLADERREDERKRVERDAARDAEFQALQKRVNNLDATIASSVTGSLSAAFQSPEFAQMIAQAVQAGINKTPSAPTAAQHTGGPDHNVEPRGK